MHKTTNENALIAMKAAPDIVQKMIVGEHLRSASNGSVSETTNNLLSLPKSLSGVVVSPKSSMEGPMLQALLRK